MSVRALATDPMVHRVQGLLGAPRSRALRLPPPRKLATADAHEGPVYVPAEHALYFTSVRPRVAIRRLDLLGRRVTTVVAGTAAANGMTAAPDGALLVCEQGDHVRPARIARLDRRTGALTTVVDACEGVPLNSPNDIVVGPDGAVWFTDPSYGHLQGFRPPPARRDAVIRHDPATGDTRVVTDIMDKPNGLAFSPDGSTLYVTDSGAPRHVRSFAVRGPRLGRSHVLLAPSAGEPDGLKVDARGRIYCSAAGGVEIFSAGGAPIGAIDLPGAVNFAFGPAGRRLLFITDDTAVWAASLDHDPKGA
jgi:gluconolactonase